MIAHFPKRGFQLWSNKNLRAFFSFFFEGIRDNSCQDKFAGDSEHSIEINRCVVCCGFES